MAKLMLYSGKIVDIFNLQIEDVDAEVIIRGACRINRFLGQTKYAYPVAAHLIGGYWYLCKIGASELTKKQWLIHESFESYSGVDLPSPLKAKLSDYKEAEIRALKVIAEAFGIDPAESKEVKALDRAIMVAEALYLLPNKEYWEEFALQNDIQRLERESNFVLDSIWCDEKNLYETLNDIWSDVFGKKDIS